MKTDLNRSIETKEQANAFIIELFNNGELFHFDDPVEDIIWNDSQLSIDETMMLKNIVDQLFSIPDYDPFDIACELTKTI